MMDEILKKVRADYSSLNNHPLYSSLNNLPRLKFFMERHIYAVLDFMTLVKNLQKKISPMGTLWSPPENPTLCRFIGEIILEEETDQLPTGEYLSHFQIYCRALKEIQGNPQMAIEFSQSPLAPSNKLNFESFLLPKSVRNFLAFNQELIRESKAHTLAASFYFGREKAIPIIFKSILKETLVTEKEAPMFHFYLGRHIELDSNEHGPKAKEMIKYFCQDKKTLCHEVLLTAKKVIEQRVKFWDEILEEMQETRI